MKPRTLLRLGSFALGAGVVLPGEAAAHAFGQRYDLPLPLSYYVVGAGAAVALSFVIMALFLRDRDRAFRSRAWSPPPDSAPWRWLGRTLRLVLRVLSVLLFVLILLSGFLGDQNPTRNFAPTFIWVLWWVGLTYIQALLGDVWAIANPWRVLHEWAEKLLSGHGVRPRPRFPYPAWLGYWPAIVFFFLFSWMELVSSAAEEPAALATIVLVYSVITWAGMTLFGREAWLGQAEAFSVVFGIIARFAPLDLSGRPQGATGDSRPFRLRPYGVGLLTEKPLPTSAICLVVLMLATVTFDGIGETPLWAGFLDWVVASETLRAPLLALQGAGVNLLALLKTLGLIATPLIFCLAYAFFSVLTARAAGGDASACEAAGAFVLTLVPIAFAYHLAHYFSYLLLAGQLVIPLASDPFGAGWNLFGTANHAMNIGVITVKSVWWIAVAAIVIGHLYAVYLAHVMALRLYRSGRAAIRSQIPLLFLMVGYTMISLWILSQPIVETG
jgi:hypothetical protein